MASHEVLVNDQFEILADFIRLTVNHHTQAIDDKIRERIQETGRIAQYNYAEVIDAELDEFEVAFTQTIASHIADLLLQSVQDRGFACYRKRSYVQKDTNSSDDNNTYSIHPLVIEW